MVSVTRPDVAPRLDPLYACRPRFQPLHHRAQVVLKHRHVAERIEDIHAGEGVFDQSRRIGKGAHKLPFVSWVPDTDTNLIRRSESICFLEYPPL